MPPSQQPLETQPPVRQNSIEMAQSRQGRPSEHMARSTGVPQRLRNNDAYIFNPTNYPPESWVEISSQPSSSSLSSIGDEIVTTGLRVQQTSPSTSRRRRRTHPGPSRIGLEARQTSTSSQEEYDESSSSNEDVLTSSNEHILPASSHIQHAESYSSDDDDENATALGPPHSVHAPTKRLQSSPFRARLTDHDAALRASLTTLLSIGAAAARGKRNATTPSMPTTSANTGLRFVPESELMGNVIQPNTSRPLSPSTRARSSPSISSAEAVEKGKRKAASSAEKTKEKRRKRIVVQDADSTLLTWVTCAGVLMLVSVVGFGA
ncbi:hypothetical protein LSUE1_G009352, partial [Lachnellula suecica]